MTNQTKETNPPEESLPKIGSDFTPTPSRSLTNKTRDFLIYTKDHTGLMIFEIEAILKEVMDLAGYIVSSGHPLRTPAGIFSIVLLPKESEFSTQGMGSKLFPKEQIVPYLFNRETEKWGYQYTESLPLRKSIRRMLAKQGIATKIQKQHETSLFRYRYSESFRKHGQ